MSMKIPFQIGSDTSEAAAEAQKGKAPSAIRRIYVFLLARGELGATDDEIRLALGMLPSTAGARRRDLELKGACFKTSHRRLTAHGHPAVVYQAVPGADLSTRKIGRPRKDKHHSKKVGAYLLPETYEDLEALAYQEGLPVAVVIRHAIENTIKEKGMAGTSMRMKEERIDSAISALESIGNNTTTGGSDAESI